MAYDLGPQTLVSLVAAEDLSDWQYKIVYIDSNGQAAQLDDGGGEIPAGVLQNAPTSGQTANVLVAGVTKATSNSGFALQNLLGTEDSSGKLTNVIAGNYVVGQPITAPGADDDVFTALVNFATTYVGS